MENRAFTKIHRELLAILRRKKLSARMQPDLEDLAQEGALRILRIIQSGQKKLSEINHGYLAFTANSVFCDKYRWYRCRPEEQIPEGYDNPSANDDPEHRAASQELGRAIRDSLRELNDDRRRAVTLKLQGHKVRQIAVLLGCNAKRADNLAYRGLEELRQALHARGHHASLKPPDDDEPGSRTTIFRPALFQP